MNTDRLSDEHRDDTFRTHPPMLYACTVSAGYATPFSNASAMLSACNASDLNKGRLGVLVL